MSLRTLPVTAILAAGVGMGFAGDFLLRAPGEPGLNVALLFAGMAASVGIVSQNGGTRLSREALGWMTAGILLGTGLLWRGSGLLRFLAFVSAAACFALPALHAGRAWVRRAGVGHLLAAVAASGVHTAFGASRLLQKGQSATEDADEAHRTARTVARSASVGVLLASLPLAIFGGLFLSADPVFSAILEDFVSIDLASFASHLVVIVVLSWLACGYLAGFTSGTRMDGLRKLGWELPDLRPGEVAVALGLVNLLFLAFVAVQFRYLFGGSALVEVTPGLTYASYAREGFFQLVAATALGLPWLLAADGLLGRREGSARWIFRALAGVQLVLLMAIVASAVQRMRAYLDAYGLTEDRFVATAVLLWLALLLLWFGATVLREQRQGFAFGTLVSGLGLVAVLHLADPSACAARNHLDRARSALHQESDPGAGLDVTYLTTLGSDATPILVGRIHELTETARCRVASALLSRWGPDRESDWRNWNLADWRARRVVGAEATRLEAMTERGGGCQ
jgi:hypothetical protein